jgi:hypothetical protein
MTTELPHCHAFQFRPANLRGLPCTAHVATPLWSDWPSWYSDAAEPTLVPCPRREECMTIAPDALKVMTPWLAREPAAVFALRDWVRR